MIHVVTVVYNQLKLTQRCLDSLLKNSTVAKSLTIVDNDSQDGTQQWLSQTFAPLAKSLGWEVTLLSNLSNQGFGRAVNRGFQTVQSPFFVILNNDTWLMPAWDEKLLGKIKSLSADMVSPALVEIPWEDFWDGPQGMHPDLPREMMPKKIRNFVTRNRLRVSRNWGSVCMFFKTESFRKAQCFDERFFLTYEDADLQYKMDRLGMHYFTTGNCMIWHASKGTRAHESLPKDYEKEARELFIEKWGIDPVAKDHTPLGRAKRRWAKVKRRMGLL